MHVSYAVLGSPVDVDVSSSKCLPTSQGTDELSSSQHAAHVRKSVFSVERCKLHLFNLEPLIHHRFISGMLHIPITGFSHPQMSSLFLRFLEP